MAEPVLKQGSKGEAVKRLQGLLQGLGYEAVTADGVVGPKTWAALGA